MTQHTANETDLQPLLELTQAVGSDPLLTQGSTGNSSIKIDGVLWIKSSGKWMMDALRDDIFTSLELSEIRDCLRRDVDPGQVWPAASLETAMHATIPHRVVLHVHCVDTIAWAVRRDAESELERRLAGLRWRWIRYTDSGLPLAREIGRALSDQPDTDVFVLGNHGLVLGGSDPQSIERLLTEVRARISITPRIAHPADYSALAEMSEASALELPEDDRLHALGTDRISQSILAQGLLYPCQTIFTGSRTAQPFRSIGFAAGDEWKNASRDRQFAIVEGRGLLVSKSISPSELEMISGLAAVVQRVSPSAPLRYLTDPEVARISAATADRYRFRSC